jgi:hypothetical protein
MEWLAIARDADVGTRPVAVVAAGLRPLRQRRRVTYVHRALADFVAQP